MTSTSHCYRARKENFVRGALEVVVVVVVPGSVNKQQEKRKDFLKNISNNTALQYSTNTPTTN